MTMAQKLQLDMQPAVNEEGKKTHTSVNKTTLAAKAPFAYMSGYACTLRCGSCRCLPRPQRCCFKLSNNGAYWKIVMSAADSVSFYFELKVLPEQGVLR